MGVCWQQLKLKQIKINKYIRHTILKARKELQYWLQLFTLQLIEFPLGVLK
jgi:hypothetical protein